MDASILAGMLDHSGAMEAAVGVARRILAEAIDELDPVQDNKYSGGLRAIAAHLHELLDRF
jgi:hypothetical protein